MHSELHSRILMSRCSASGLSSSLSSTYVQDIDHAGQGAVRAYLAYHGSSTAALTRSVISQGFLTGSSARIPRAD